MVVVEADEAAAEAALVVVVVAGVWLSSAHAKHTA
jgi:hypothetical protein